VGCQRVVGEAWEGDVIWAARAFDCPDLSRIPLPRDRSAPERRSVEAHLARVPTYSPQRSALSVSGTVASRGCVTTTCGSLRCLAPTTR